MRKLWIVLLLGVIWAGESYAYGIRTGDASCSGTAAVVGSSTDRAVLMLVNIEAGGGTTIYIGTSAVTTSIGFPIFPQIYASTGDQQSSWVTLPSARTDIYCRTTGATAHLRFLEVVR